MDTPDPLNQRKEDFLRIVSHQLRTPLTSLREGVSQILEGIHGDVNETQRQFLTLCMQDVDRLTTVVENLLDISTIVRGQLMLKREKTDIHAIIQNVISGFREQAKAKGIAIHCRGVDTPLYAYADRERIIQVFNKLTENAVEFTRQGEISIMVTEKPYVIECVVRDTGEGIPREYQEKVFETFEQMVLHPLPRKKNVGLGLAVAKGIIEAHDGDIWIDSALGEGTAVTFLLPKYDVSVILEKCVSDELDMGFKTALILFSFTPVGDNLPDTPVLSSIVDRLRNCIRQTSDTIVRGTDSVFTVLHSVEKETAGVIAARLKTEIESILSKSGVSDRMSFTIREFHFPQDGKTFGELPGVFITHIDKKETIDEGGVKMENDKKKILVVDDEENVSIMTTSRLRSSGFDVVSAPNGHEGLRMAQRENPDLILLDVVMPDMDGYKVLAKLKDSFRTKQIPVIMFTAENRIGDVTNAIEMGAEDYIIKPFTTEVLMEKIQRVLHKVEMRKQKEREDREKRQQEGR
ncbi:MAG: response regulator [Candidatus Omnitrophica bacterium]|nr:response regulator [Candidatus Omnitrophota bacterium]